MTPDNSRLTTESTGEEAPGINTFSVEASVVDVGSASKDVFPAKIFPAEEAAIITNQMLREINELKKLKIPASKLYTTQNISTPTFEFNF